MKKLAVIGGGFAGASIAKALETKSAVTLVDSKTYFEFHPGLLRAIVEPKHFSSIQVSHRAYLKRAVLITGKAEGLFKKNVLVNGRKINFDYCVICSGSRYKPPIGMDGFKASQESMIQTYHGNLEKSESVLIIGGGLVGVELAGEICNAYPSKKIILAHSHNRLGERMNPRASRLFHDHLEKKGVRILLNTGVINKDGKFYSDKDKQLLEAQCVFSCTGIKPNSGFIKKTMPSLLDETGHVIVNQYLQVKGFQTVFAGGDVTNIHEEKTAQNADKHAAIVTANILALEQNKPLTAYIPGKRLMVTSLGKTNGVITYRRFSLGGILAGVLKQLIEWFILWKYR